MTTKADTPRTLTELLRGGGSCDSCECHDWGKSGMDYGGVMLDAADKIDQLERELSEKTRGLEMMRKSFNIQCEAFDIQCRFREEARDRVLEEAAKECDEFDKRWPKLAGRKFCAERIRALKGKK